MRKRTKRDTETEKMRSMRIAQSAQDKTRKMMLFREKTGLCPICRGAASNRVTCGDAVCVDIWIARRVTVRNEEAFKGKSARFQKEWGRLITPEYRRSIGQEYEKELVNMHSEQDYD